MNCDSQSLYRSNSEYIRKTFGERVQKIVINTGYSCPNRDGTKGLGGCTYCNINSIKPNYAKAKKSITQQLAEGIEFFSRKNTTKKYLAYFQSYTNTYNDIDALIKDYEEALRYEGVLGLVIATRPDCIPPELINYLSTIAKAKYISLELGIESTNDNTLKKINRCHSYQETIDAITLLSKNNISVGGHLILGFPWESKEEMIQHAKNISLLPIQQIKLHHLQVLQNTELARQYSVNPFSLMRIDEYLELVINFLEHLRPNIVVQRFIAESPKHLLIAPQWNGIRNRDFTTMVKNKLKELNTWQGKMFGKHIEILKTNSTT